MDPSTADGGRHGVCGKNAVEGMDRLNPTMVAHDIALDTPR